MVKVIGILWYKNEIRLLKFNSFEFLKVFLNHYITSTMYAVINDYKL